MSFLCKILVTYQRGIEVKEMLGWMIVTDSYKKLLKRWPGESTEGLIGRYRLKLVFTFTMMEDGGSNSVNNFHKVSEGIRW